jgi:hypothetical protein
MYTLFAGKSFFAHINGRRSGDRYFFDYASDCDVLRHGARRDAKSRYYAKKRQHRSE